MKPKPKTVFKTVFKTFRLIPTTNSSTYVLVLANVEFSKTQKQAEENLKNHNKSGEFVILPVITVK